MSEDGIKDSVFVRSPVNITNARVTNYIYAKENRTRTFLVSPTPEQVRDRVATVSGALHHYGQEWSRLLACGSRGGWTPLRSSSFDLISDRKQPGRMVNWWHQVPGTNPITVELEIPDDLGVVVTGLYTLSDPLPGIWVRLDTDGRIIAIVDTEYGWEPGAAVGMTYPFETPITMYPKTRVVLCMKLDRLLIDELAIDTVHLGLVGWAYGDHNRLIGRYL